MTGHGDLVEYEILVFDNQLIPHIMVSKQPFWDCFLFISAAQSRKVVTVILWMNISTVM